VNDREIIFHLTAPDSQFLTAISEQQGGLEVRSKANYDVVGPPNWKTGFLAGSGPYQFREGAEGQYIRYERNPAGHYKGVPEFPEFEFRMAKEASTRMASLLAGEAHMADLPQDLVPTAVARGMKTVRGAFPGTRIWGAFQGAYIKDPKDLSQGYIHPDSPFLDRRVRQALNKAINRDEMNKAFFGGKAETMILNHFHPSRAGWNPEWEKRFQEQYGYDPAAAKRLLAEAGQSNWKATMSIVALPGVSGGQDLAEAVAGYWKAAGIDVTLVTPDAAEETRLSRAYTYTDRLSLRSSGNNLWSGFIVWNSSTGNRGNGFEDVEIDKLLPQIPVTMDDTARETLWRKVGDLAFADMLSVHLFYLPAEAVVDPRIVADWAFPGDITGSWTHIVNIKAAR
jgi:peptide/nickel transport system substrate-binding protein